MSALPPPPPSHGSPYYGPSGYGAGYPSRPVQPLEGLSLAVSILLGVMVLLSLLAAGAFFNRASVIDDFLNGGDPVFQGLDDLDDADALVGGASLLWFLGLVATGVVFIVWQYRHAKNAEAIGGPGGLGAPWAIAGWFIPCANYVLPAVEMAQSSQPSDPDLPPGAPPRRGRISGLVVPWAIVFGIGSLLAGAGRSLFPDEDDVARDFDRAEDGITADNLTAAGFLILVVAAVLAILMVRSLTKRQAAKAAALPAGPYGYGYGPPPGPPGAGYPGSPGAGYPGSPGGGYPGQPGAGYPGQSGGGYGGPGHGPPPAQPSPPYPPAAPAPPPSGGWRPPGQQGPGGGWPPAPGS